MPPVPVVPPVPPELVSPGLTEAPPDPESGGGALVGTIPGPGNGSSGTPCRAGPMKSFHVAAGSVARAQTIRGTITGTVTDSTGAVVPGATVTVTHAATGIGTSAQTNREGLYTIPLLPPGSYQATVELSGFKKYLRGGIVVQIAG